MKFVIVKDKTCINKLPFFSVADDGSCFFIVANNLQEARDIAQNKIFLANVANVSAANPDYWMNFIQREKIRAKLFARLYPIGTIAKEIKKTTNGIYYEICNR